MMDFVQMSSGGPPASMRCCCGSPECELLQQNYSVLDSVEQDVQHAARAGAALLARHESYMADAEKDRAELTTRIGRLEMDNKELEIRNAKTISENRGLLDKLESLNSAVSDDEDRIKALEATLLSSQQIIRRLEGETAKAEVLERQLAFLEEEQADLRENLATTQEDARSAMKRWRRAERGIAELQGQLERMEREARTERERHAEVMDRMEKQREIEKALDTSAGRLKAAAAAKSLEVDDTGGTVVSHFVRDLLQDNANLQQGIVELREILMHSNDEMQAMREQMLYHQPLGECDLAAAPTLRTELESSRSPDPSPTSPTNVSQELHVHHHHHVASSKADMKKPKKKRNSLTPLTTPMPSTPPSIPWRPHHHNRMSRDSSVPSHRWSVFSEPLSDFAPSSAPSSPQSHCRNSLFDTVVIDSSYPASPATSADPVSPKWRGTHRKQKSNVSARSLQAPTNLALTPAPRAHNHTIVEENDDHADVPDLTITTSEESAEDEDTPSKQPTGLHDDIECYLTNETDGRRPRHRRTTSHESIMSLGGGLDIHTLKSRPSQLGMRHISSATSIAPSCTVTARPIMASSAITARPIMVRSGANLSSALLRDRYGSYGARAGGLQRTDTETPPTPSVLGKLSSWRPWSGNNNASGSTEGKSGRLPGINQSGAIPGFSQYWAAHQKRVPSKVWPEMVDRDALKDGLAE